MKKFLLTAVLAVIGSWVWAQNIAVFPFEDMENVLTQNQAKMFYQEFSNEFKNRMPDKSVVPREDVDRLINTEAVFQLTDFSAQEKTAEMMKVQNATQILSGIIGRLGNDIRITVSLYMYPELKQLPGGTTLSVSNVSELFSRIPALVQTMQNEIANAKGEPIPEGLRYEVVDGRTVAITRYTGNAATINIPSRIAGLPVTAIRHDAFRECERLTSVTIPSTVTSIGESAFISCSSLTNITIPSSVTSIGYAAFYWCYSLTSITVDNNNSVYASIDDVLFDKNIKTIIRYPAGRNQETYLIPPSVTSIEDGAFSGCDHLTSVIIPSSVTFIGEHAFTVCSLISVTIPSSVTSIGNSAFSFCRSLSSVTIPSSVTVIGEGTFIECISLTSVTIPSSVTSIGEYAFYYCSSLTSVTIPASVTSIGRSAFGDCRRLFSITLSRRTQVGQDAFPNTVKVVYRD